MSNEPLCLMQKFENAPTLLAEIVVRRTSCNVSFFHEKWDLNRKRIEF